MLSSIGKQSGESVEGVESVLKKKKKVTVGRICRKGRSDKWKSEEVMDDDSESIEPIEEVPFNPIHRTRRIRIGEISAWLTERRELIPDTTGSILEGTICYS